jgi:arylformamidase
MSRIIDLTLPLTDGDRGVSITPARRLETDGWNTTTLNLYSHCGTHMDAPIHFGVTDQTIDQLPVDKLMSEAWVVNLDPAEPRLPIEPHHLGDIADKLQPGESLIIRTGWSRYYGQPAYRDELPRISADLAQWCVDHGVRMLGVEQPSVADVNNAEELTAIHKILLGGGIIIVEGLTNLDKISEDKVTLVALPLKITGGDGAPARVLAIEDF